MLTGGENHGLLATFRPGTDLPETFRPIGTVLGAGGVPDATVGQVLVDCEMPPGGVGWDQFQLNYPNRSLVTYVTR